MARRNWYDPMPADGAVEEAPKAEKKVVKAPVAKKAPVKKTEPKADNEQGTTADEA